MSAVRAVPLVQTARAMSEPATHLCPTPKRAADHLWGAILQFLMHCNKNIASHKNDTAGRSGPPARLKERLRIAALVLGSLPSYFCCTSAQFLTLFRERCDLRGYVFLMQRHHILRLFGLQQLLNKFE
jgi:hypothetical protein